MNDTVLITVDDRPVRCHAGDTIAAALTRAGIDTWRTTRYGEARRGLFCGIGVCFDCLVAVNGEPPVRACLATVRDGDRILTTGGGRDA